MFYIQLARHRLTLFYFRSSSAFSEKLVEVIEACRSVPRRCDVVPILEIDSPLRQADSEKRQSLQQDSSLAAQFAKTFALADDPSSLWTATNVGLVRTLPVWGAIALSEHFFCFYRHGILVADVLVRIPLVDIDDAVPVRAFGFRIWGLAIQVYVIAWREYSRALLNQITTDMALRIVVSTLCPRKRETRPSNASSKQCCRSKQPTLQYPNKARALIDQSPLMCRLRKALPSTNLRYH